MCAVTSSEEARRQIEFSDALVQPFSKWDEVRRLRCGCPCGRDVDTYMLRIWAQETIAVEASQATLPALLSQMHAHVLKSIRECMSDDG